MILNSRGIVHLHEQVWTVVVLMWGASPEAAALVTQTIAERILRAEEPRWKQGGLGTLAWTARPDLLVNAHAASFSRPLIVASSSKVTDSPASSGGDS